MTASFPRIESALGGVQIAAATEQALNTLIKGRVREDTDIEFKGELYGNSDADKRDLAGDVVAMSNALGGVIFLGVQAVGGVADELTPVSLDEKEELRIRQILASLVAPPVDFEILRVSSAHSGQGFYLLVIPPSPSRPHAVRVNKALRYPLRDGAHTRYLAESEVADFYRSRFTRATDQQDRLDLVHSEALEHVSADDSLWLTVCLVPDRPGSMRLDRASITRFRALGDRYNGGFGSAIFGGFDVTTGFRRIVIRNRLQPGPSDVAHAELHTDGSGFAATQVWTPGMSRGRKPDLDEPLEGRPWLEDEYLVYQMIALLRLVVEHAVSNCGVGGDAAIRASLDGFNRAEGDFVIPPRLMQRRRYGFEESRSQVELLRSPVSLHTINVASVFGSTRELLVVCRLVLTEFFQAFGVPELEQIREDGAVRRRYFTPQQELLGWAAQNDVEVIDSTIESEHEGLAE